MAHGSRVTFRVMASVLAAAVVSLAGLAWTDLREHVATVEKRSTGNETTLADRGVVISQAGTIAKENQTAIGELKTEVKVVETVVKANQLENEKSHGRQEQALKDQGAKLDAILVEIRRQNGGS